MSKRPHSPTNNEELAQADSYTGEPAQKRAALSNTNSGDYIRTTWHQDVAPALAKFIEVPNLSPGFDANVLTNGFQEQAMEVITNWIKSQDVKGLTVDILRLEGRTPLIFMELPASQPTNETILMYGHFDKQPPMTETWREGLHPYKPVFEGSKLYGRGGADDGYASFAAIVAMKDMQLSGKPHARLVVMVEGCEESGSKDLVAYIELCRERIGTPSLVICLDSGCANYEQMWMTTNLRGVVVGSIKVQGVQEGMHSGSASGIAPDTFRVATALLHEHVVDTFTGEVHSDFQVEIPTGRLAELESTAALLGDDVWKEFTFVEGAGPMGSSNLERLTNRTWKATATITGAEGLPTLALAGNVLRPYTSLMLSLRCPPTLDAKKAADLLAQKLNCTYMGCQVTFKLKQYASGWNAPATAPWLEAAVQKASHNAFGKPCLGLGEGGTIPFMGMLGEMFPQAQFLITGVLGPGSNAHGPNEFIDMDFAASLVHCVVDVIGDHFNHFVAGN